MNAQQAGETLEVIRTLMERTTQYRLLTASASLAAGNLACAGALAFMVVDQGNPYHFGVIWGLVLVGSLLAATVGTIMRGRERGERVWSRQARAVVVALAPSFFAAAVLTVFFFGRGMHLWLPGIWMLCYGQGALATSTYAPASIRGLGLAMIMFGGPALWLGPAWAIVLMGIVFGLGHVGVGVALLVAERRETRLRVVHDVA
jgi:hypothetical protein